MKTRKPKSRVRNRFLRLASAGLEDRLQLVTGSLRDYQALCEHHYRAQSPATATRVLVLRHHAPTVVGRYLQRHGETQAVGVLVESLPALNCRMRDWAMGNRFSGLSNARQRARLLTQDLRCISRVVVQPQWRGLGLAVRLVRCALAQPTTPFTEALAAMGKVHPFFEKAGMTAYHRPPHAHDARLADALSAAGFDPVDLAMLDAVMRRVDAMPAQNQRWLLAELRRWYCQTHRQSNIGPIRPRQQLETARERLLCQPVYYLADSRRPR